MEKVFTTLNEAVRNRGDGEAIFRVIGGGRGTFYVLGDGFLEACWGAYRVFWGGYDAVPLYIKVEAMGEESIALNGGRQ